ncbi:MAG: NAD(P)H-dependent oxidoreductase [Methanobrevibacter sp.]|uniref:flavodoxin n=1 Tax=Methanobrevibacter sp. TaxID=66852 RepID=UPI0025ECE442|nr:flavodoxin [Methanobrevibacter sp.]MBR0271308.1 NAD(P)H-dependent oxidoreductase [Methanobrevibacter sp.]
MKKILLISIIALIILAVGISEAAAMSDAEAKANDILKKNNTNSKVLVVYFSKTGENYNVGDVEVGNTAMMASYIKEYLNADSFEIVPVNPYPDDYKETTDQASKEQSDNARPEIKNKIDNFDSYDTIFIGYPIWWGDLPNIMYTFLEQYDFSGKTVIPFNTHEGSGDAGTYQTIASQLPEAKVNTDGLAIDGKTARTEDGKQQTIEWLKGLGF